MQSDLSLYERAKQIETEIQLLIHQKSQCWRMTMQLIWDYQANPSAKKHQQLISHLLTYQDLSNQIAERRDAKRRLFR